LNKNILVEPLFFFHTNVDFVDTLHIDNIKINSYLANHFFNELMLWTLNCIDEFIIYQFLHLVLGLAHAEIYNRN